MRIVTGPGFPGTLSESFSPLRRHLVQAFFPSVNVLREASASKGSVCISFV